MAKYPTNGEVKTRISREIGDDAATEIYTCFLRDTLYTVTRSRSPYMIYYYPEEEREGFGKLLGEEHTYTPQTGADLGERLENGFKAAYSMGYTAAVALASDVPDLPAGLLNEAAEALESSDAVIGPSPDGGYYLIGFTAKGFTSDAFKGITWSTETVHSETLKRLESAELTLHTLEAWPDTDTVEDLRRLKESLRDRFRDSHTLRYLDEHPDLL